MTKIDRIRCFMTRVDDRPRLLVSITTTDGLTGWGEAYNHGPDLALAPVIDWLAHQFAGEDATRVTYLNQKLLQHCRFPPGALGLAAIAAIDHALWDIAAKALDVPVYFWAATSVTGSRSIAVSIPRQMSARPSISSPGCAPRQAIAPSSCRPIGATPMPGDGGSPVPAPHTGSARSARPCPKSWNLPSTPMR